MKIHRFATIISVILVSLPLTACTPFFGGSGMNPHHAEDLRNASKMESIEAFQRDIEPAIVAARNEILTSENIRKYGDKDHISRRTAGNQYLYSMFAAQYFFEEHDVDRFRSVVNAHLEPLGFEIVERKHIDDGKTRIKFYWVNERYGATVSALISLSPDLHSSYTYDTEPLRSDGSTDDPNRLIDLPGRVPDWFDPTTTPTR